MSDYRIEDLSTTAGLTDDHIMEVENPGSDLSEKATLAQLRTLILLNSPTIIVPNFPGIPAASQYFGAFPAPVGVTTFTAAINMAGSSGKAMTAATAQYDIDVRKNATTSANGTSVGTIRFAASATVPTFIAVSSFSLTGGSDWLSFWGQATPDSTLANIAVSLYFTRS